MTPDLIKEIAIAVLLLGLAFALIFLCVERANRKLAQARAERSEKDADRYRDQRHMEASYRNRDIESARERGARQGKREGRIEVLQEYVDAAKERLAEAQATYDRKMEVVSELRATSVIGNMEEGRRRLAADALVAPHREDLRQASEMLGAERTRQLGVDLSRDLRFTLG